jgi:hypothetical protein
MTVCRGVVATGSPVLTTDHNVALLVQDHNHRDHLVFVIFFLSTK